MHSSASTAACPRVSKQKVKLLYILMLLVFCFVVFRISDFEKKANGHSSTEKQTARRADREKEDKGQESVGTAPPKDWHVPGMSPLVTWLLGSSLTLHYLP